MRSWTVAVMLFTACLPAQEAVELQAVDHNNAMMMGATMTLTTTEDWVGSLDVVVTVTDAPANSTIRLMRSANLAGMGACPMAIQPLCVDVAGPVTIVASKKSNAQGTVNFNVAVPDPVVDAEWEVQAVFVGLTSEKSNATIVTLHDLGSDLDGDGLFAEDEVTVHFTDPMVVDTDADAFWDGTEVTATTDPLDSADFPPTYDDDIYPDLMLVECTPCHVNGMSSGGFNMDDYANIVNAVSNDVATMDRIEPFDTANSYLWHKVNGTQNQVGGAGKQMPRDGPPFLTVDQLALIEDWINTGALEAADG